MQQRFALAALALAAVTAIAAPAAPAAPAARPAAASTPAAAHANVAGATFVRDVEGIHEYRLPNGLQVLLVPDPAKPTVTVNVTYRVGSRHELYGETGMAHLLEHLMFKSTPSIHNVGAELSRRGMDFNGSTNEDRTNYFETFPADAEPLAWALKTEADRMTHANVLRQELDTEMTVVRNEMESGENDPGAILNQKTRAAAYQWHSYRSDTIGARADVENVNIAHLQAFYRKYYQPDNATLIVAGRFDETATLAQVVREFGRIPKPTRVLEKAWTVEPVQDGEHEVTVRRVGGMQRLEAVYHVPAYASKETAALRVIAQALSDAPTGRLYRRLVEAKLATDVDGYAERKAEPGLLTFDASMRKDQPIDPVQQVFLDTIEGVGREPITEEELKRVKLQFATQIDKMMANPQSLCVGLSSPIAAGDYRLLFQLRDRVAALTLDEVNATARAWIKPSNRTLGRFIPVDAPDRSPLAPLPDVAAAIQGWQPQASLAAVAPFDATPAHIDAATQRFTLPSGMKVALLPKPTRGGTVEVAMMLHGGTPDSLRGKQAAAEMVSRLLGTGTTTRTRAQLADAFRALHTDWHVTMNPVEGVSAGLNTRHDAVVPALALLGEVLREASFTPVEFDRSVQQAIGDLEQEDTDPNSIANRALLRLTDPWPADDIRYTPTVAEGIAGVKALKREDVAALWAAYGGADHAEIAIVGDFDPAAVKAQLLASFGSWRSTQPWVRVVSPMSAVAGQRVAINVKDKANASIVGQLPMPLRDTDPDYPALRVASQVLGESGIGSRLSDRLRQKDGLSYGAGGYLNASSFVANGGITFYAIFAPQNRAKVEQGFAEEIARFARDGITAGELAQAKKGLLLDLATTRADDSRTALRWTGRLDRDRTWQWDADQDARIAAVTLDQVNAAIRKWIVPSRVDWALSGEFHAAASAAPAKGAGPAGASR